MKRASRSTSQYLILPLDSISSREADHPPLFILLVSLIHFKHDIFGTVDVCARGPERRAFEADHGWETTSSSLH